MQRYKSVEIKPHNLTKSVDLFPHISEVLYNNLEKWIYPDFVTIACSMRTTEPKFLQKKRTTALSYSDLENMSTFENDKEEKL